LQWRRVTSESFRVEWKCVIQLNQLLLKTIAGDYVCPTVDSCSWLEWAAERKLAQARANAKKAPRAIEYEDDIDVGLFSIESEKHSIQNVNLGNTKQEGYASGKLGPKTETSL
jgi:hypothetical protein